jgi:hypothetical protein
MNGIEGGDFIWIDFGIMDCGPPIPFGFCKEMVCTWRIEGDRILSRPKSTGGGAV